VRHFDGRREGALMQLVRVQPRELSVHPGSYPSSGEGDRPVEASGTTVRIGGLASVRAATRVKPEQASKAKMRALSRHQNGEGRWGRSEQPTGEDQPARRGTGRGTQASIGAQHGRPAAVCEQGKAAAGVGGAHSTGEAGESRWREGALVRGASQRVKGRGIGMSLTTRSKLRRLHEALYAKAKRVCAAFAVRACLGVRPVREPGAGNRHAGFDERSQETGAMAA